AEDGDEAGDLRADRNKGGGDPEKPSKIPAELALIPADTVGFAHIKVGELLKGDAAEGLRTQFGAQLAPLVLEVEKFLGLPSEKIVPATVVVLAPQRPGDEPRIVVMITAADYRRSDVQERVVPDAELRTHNGKPYYVSKKKEKAESALHFATLD